MLQVTPHMRILVCMKPVDFRKGIDGIAAVCRNHLKQDPHGGILFLFRNRARCSIRILMYDGQGFWLCIKRLSKNMISSTSIMGMFRRLKSPLLLGWRNNLKFSNGARMCGPFGMPVLSKAMQSP